MSRRAVREEGFSKDADKLVRRLSLVALLLSRHGQPASAEQIRQSVEGYPLMTDDAFKRRFYEDRAELARLGIEIVVEPAAEGIGEVYRLPADAYYLPPVELSQDELTALAACLGVLESRFSYSQPLRLALLSLAQGRPQLLAQSSTPTLAVMAETDRKTVAAVLTKLQAAIADRKTVTFDYYAISRDETLTRQVDPYGLQLIGGEWYMVGRCHLRDALRTFRMSRIRSRVTYATRAPHDFEPPPDFSLSSFRDRPAWQLSEPHGTASIRVAPSLAWWVEAHWSQCGTIRHHADGSIVLETAYADARPLLSWVFGMGQAAEVLGPPALRNEAARQLRALRAALAAPPPLAPPAEPRRAADAPRRAAADLHVEVDRFTRLTALATYLLQRCPEDDEARLDVSGVMRDLQIDKESLRADVRLLNLVNFGADGALLYAEFVGRGKLHVSCDMAGPAFRRPARLAPLQADTLLLAIDLVGGQLPTATGSSLASAAAKLRAARFAETRNLASSDLLAPDERILDAVNEATRRRRLLDIEYWAEGTDRLSVRTVEPYLLLHERGEWYYVCWCRTAGGMRVFRVATTKSAMILDEEFSPRADIEVDLYRREGIPTSGAYAPKSARIWYSSGVSRWVAEHQPVELLADGSCIARQPYVDEGWLVHQLLRFAGEALPIEPEDVVATLRDVVDALLLRLPPSDGA